MTYAVYARESCDLWQWWWSGSGEREFAALVDAHGGTFGGGNFKKPFQHVAIVLVGFLCDDVGLGLRALQATCRVLVAAAIVLWLPALFGKRIAVVAAILLSLNVSSAAIWRLGMAHGQSSAFVFFAVFLFIGSWNASEARSRRLLFSAGCCAMSAVLTHMNTIPFVGVLILAEIARQWVRGRDWLGCVSLASGMLLMYLVSESWYLAHYLLLPMDEINAISIRPPMASTWEQWHQMFTIPENRWPVTPLLHRIYMYLIVPVFAEGIIVLLFVAAGLWVVLSSKAYWDTRYLLPAALIVLPVAYYCLYARNNLELRNLAALFPFACVIGAVGVDRGLSLRFSTVAKFLLAVGCIASAWTLVDLLSLRSGTSVLADRLRRDQINLAYVNMKKPPEKFAPFAHPRTRMARFVGAPDSLSEGEALTVDRKALSVQQEAALVALMKANAHWRQRINPAPKFIEYRGMTNIPKAILPAALVPMRQRVLDAYERRELVVFYGPMIVDDAFRKSFI